MYWKSAHRNFCKKSLRGLVPYDTCPRNIRYEPPKVVGTVLKAMTARNINKETETARKFGTISVDTHVYKYNPMGRHLRPVCRAVVSRSSHL